MSTSPACMTAAFASSASAAAFAARFRAALSFSSSRHKASLACDVVDSQHADEGPTA